MRFLLPFGTIDFVPEIELEDKRVNLSRVIDRKLQLELIPYASPGFAARDFSIDLLQPHFERVLGTIAALPRDYIIFCGAVFDDLLKLSGRETFRLDHDFHLATKQGMSKNEYRFSNVAFNYEGISHRAGIARSFAIQGIPMPTYGAKCYELYGLLSHIRRLAAEVHRTNCSVIERLVYAGGMTTPVHQHGPCEPDDARRAVEAVRALARAARVLERASSELSMPHYRVLSAIAAGEERASRVAERLELGRPAISSAVDAMCRGGFLVRAEVQGDQRAFDLQLTPEGFALLERVEGTMVRVIEQLCARTPDGRGVIDALASLGLAVDEMYANRFERLRRSRP